MAKIEGIFFQAWEEDQFKHIDVVKYSYPNGIKKHVCTRSVQKVSACCQKASVLTSSMLCHTISTYSFTVSKLSRHGEGQSSPLLVFIWPACLPVSSFGAGSRFLDPHKFPGNKTDGLLPAPDHCLPLSI